MAGKRDILRCGSKESQRLNVAAEAALARIDAWRAELQDDDSDLAKMVDAEVASRNGPPTDPTGDSLPPFERDAWFMFTDEIELHFQNYINGEIGAEPGDDAPGQAQSISDVKSRIDLAAKDFSTSYLIHGITSDNAEIPLPKTQEAFFSMIEEAKGKATEAYQEAMCSSVQQR